jgi:hypothetical protein
MCHLQSLYLMRTSACWHGSHCSCHHARTTCCRTCLQHESDAMDIGHYRSLSILRFLHISQALNQNQITTTVETIATVTVTATATTTIGRYRTTYQTHTSEHAMKSCRNHRNLQRRSCIDHPEKPSHYARRPCQCNCYCPRHTLNSVAPIDLMMTNDGLIH